MRLRSLRRQYYEWQVGFERQKGREPEKQDVEENAQTQRIFTELIEVTNALKAEGVDTKALTQRVKAEVDTVVADESRSRFRILVKTRCVSSLAAWFGASQQQLRDDAEIDSLAMALMQRSSFESLLRELTEELEQHARAAAAAAGIQFVSSAASPSGRNSLPYDAVRAALLQPLLALSSGVFRLPVVSSGDASSKPGAAVSNSLAKPAADVVVMGPLTALLARGLTQQQIVGDNWSALMWLPLAAVEALLAERLTKTNTATLKHHAAQV